VASGCKRFLQVPETVAWAQEHYEVLKAWKGDLLKS
jgi:hypothetical protein